MNTLTKTTFATVILVSLLSVFFSFAGMAYGSDGRMQGDCPFSNMGASLCPQSVLPGAIHHISAYQSFFNVPVNPGISALIIALLLAVSVAIVFPFRLTLYTIPIFVPYNPTPSTSHNRKIKRWLSLFENSPSD